MEDEICPVLKENGGEYKDENLVFVVKKCSKILSDAALEYVVEEELVW